MAVVQNAFNDEASSLGNDHLQKLASLQHYSLLHAVIDLAFMVINQDGQIILNVIFTGLL